MSILPQMPTPAHPGRRWEARQYPGTPSTCPRFRAELRSDLESLAGVPRRIREDVELCASEAFANAVTHSRSQRSGGTVIRMLSTPIVMGRETTLRLSVIDDGPLDARPMFPPARRSVENWAQAESGRGLQLIHQLADEWGTQRWADSDSLSVLGTVLWAEFTYPTATAASSAPCVCGGAR
ncbi:ATP-binding protein [Nocardiopsis valliformis]|uniref:ATP-binding protein n=1 Tax=Nocardiopsis valliformis TaxID=239974 RepID=UPI00034A15AB|nr:ATP-binding protein [Nocardiopsis valliformis]